MKFKIWIENRSSELNNVTEIASFLIKDLGYGVSVYKMNPIELRSIIEKEDLWPTNIDKNRFIGQLKSYLSGATVESVEHEEIEAAVLSAIGCDNESEKKFWLKQPLSTFFHSVSEIKERLLDHGALKEKLEDNEHAFISFVKIKKPTVQECIDWIAEKNEF